MALDHYNTAWLVLDECPVLCSLASLLADLGRKDATELFSYWDGLIDQLFHGISWG
jgi:hypothetical protein